MKFFGLKQGQDLEDQVAHPHKEFPRIIPRDFNDFSIPTILVIQSVFSKTRYRYPVIGDEDDEVRM